MSRPMPRCPGPRPARSLVEAGGTALSDAALRRALATPSGFAGLAAESAETVDEAFASGALAHPVATPPDNAFARFWIVSYALGLMALTAATRESRGAAQ